MVRASESQLKMFQANASGKPSAKKPRIKKRREDLPENIIEKQLCDFLSAHGWRCIRLLAGTFKWMHGQGVVTGAMPGTPDWLVIRGAEYFMLEAKASGGKLRDSQQVWIRQARQESIPVVVANNYDAFVKEYREQRPEEFVR